MSLNLAQANLKGDPVRTAILLKSNGSTSDVSKWFLIATISPPIDPVRDFEVFLLDC